VVTTYFYDARGNVIRQDGTTGPYTYSVLYSHNGADRLTGITYPSTLGVTYARNTVGQISGVTSNLSGSGATVASGITYAPFGGVSGWAFGNGQVVAITRNTDYRITGIDAAAGSTVVQDLSYGYNPAGQITAITDNANAGLSQSFGYDTLDRLTSATGPWGSLIWSYDDNGNRTLETFNAATTLNVIDSASNKLASVGLRGRAYDAAGNTTQVVPPSLTNLFFTYNGQNRLMRVNQTSPMGPLVATYVYNALGQRVAKFAPSTSTWTYFVYDLDGKLLSEQEETSGTPRLEHVYLGNLPLTVVQTESSTSPVRVYAVHTDHLGTPTRLTKDTGAVAWSIDRTPFTAVNGSFGNPNNNPDGDSVSISYPLRFPGQYADVETGLHYNYFRDYEPATGRYTQSDPIGLAGGINTYAYVGGNPLNAVDPLGLKILCWPWGCKGDHNLPPTDRPENQPEKPDYDFDLPSCAEQFPSKEEGWKCHACCSTPAGVARSGNSPSICHEQCYRNEGITEYRNEEIRHCPIARK
jgi:RHS repeat-associated protein